MSNPYDSPASVRERIPKGRVKIIPVTVLATLGCMICGIGIITGAALIYTLITREEPYSQNKRFWIPGCIFVAAVILYGTVFLVAARQWWVGNWKFGLLLIGVIVCGPPLLVVLGVIPK